MIKKVILALLLMSAPAEVWAALGAHWKLQDNAASTVVVATVGSNGVLGDAGNTSAVSGTPGPGTALTRYMAFDGINDAIYATTGNTAVLQNKAAFTLCCWFRMTTTDTDSDDRLMYVSNGSATNATRASIGCNSSGQIICVARAGDGESAQSKTTDNSYDDSTWHHVAMVVDIAADTITIYIDGSSVSSTGTISFTASSTSNTASQSVTLAINNFTNPYKGRLADCRIYDSNESANLSAIMAEKDIAALIDPLSTSIPGSSADPLTGTIPGL